MRRSHVILTTSMAAALSMFASTGAVASTGTVPAGSTISATAWEREIDNFTYDSGSVSASPDGVIDEYVYRIFAGDSSVDVQSTDGYTGLTAAEQTQWYEDEGLTPYEFTWMAFYCRADDAGAGVNTDAGIELDDMIYVAADDLFPSDSRTFFGDYYTNFFVPWDDASLYGLDDFNEDLESVVGYWASGYEDIIFSTSYADFSCPADSTLVYGRIKDPNDTDSFATDRELTIPDVITVETSAGDVEVNADNVYIGVTGQVFNIDFNAALWGMTQVDGTLANTGLSFDPAALGMIAVGATAVGAVAATRRRRTNS